MPIWKSPLVNGNSCAQMLIQKWCHKYKILMVPNSIPRPPKGCLHPAIVPLLSFIISIYDITSWAPIGCRNSCKPLVKWQRICCSLNRVVQEILVQFHVLELHHRHDRVWEASSYTWIPNWTRFDRGQISIETATHSLSWNLLWLFVYSTGVHNGTYLADFQHPCEYREALVVESVYATA